MEFTLGDIIVFVAVAIVLFIYRQLDKNSQSLAKVKRFTDKVLGDLGGQVDSKTEELKNLTIELDVHLKTAREILKRVTTIEEDLKGKTKGVDEINKRISEYDNALTGLVSMTRKVDENLSRLHSESQFVDTVGKRVKDAMAQMNQVEKSIPALKSQFAKENADQLKSLTGEVVRATEELVDSISVEVVRAQDSVEEFSARTSKLVAKCDDMEEETLNNLRNRFQELIVEADDSRDKLLNQFKNDLGILLDQEEEKGRTLIDEIKGRHGALRNEVTNTQELLNQKLEAFQDRITGIEDDYQRVLREAAEKGRSLEDEVFIKLKDHVESRARSVENDLSGVMNESKERLETSRKELVSMFGETRSQITVWRAELQKKMDESVGDFEGRYEKFSGEVGEKLEVIVSDTGRSQAEQRRALEEFITATQAEIEQLEEGVTGKVSELKGRIQQSEQEFKSAMDNAENSNRIHAEQASERMTGQIGEFEDSLNGRYGELERKISEFETSVGYRFDRVEAVHADIEALEANLKKNMDLAVGKAGEALKSALERISQDRASEKVRAEEQLAEVHNSMEAIDRELTGLKSKAYANVSEQLQVFEDDFFSNLKGRNDEMQARVETWEQEVEEKVDSIVKEQQKARSEAEMGFSDQLKAKLEELHREMGDQYGRFESQVSEFQNRLQSRMAGAEGNLEGLEEQLKSDMADLRRASSAAMEGELSDLSLKIGDELKEHQLEVNSSLRVLGERVEERTNAAENVLETARRDVGAWQESILEEMRETKTTMAEEFESFRDSVRVRQDELATTTEEENLRMRDELEETRGIVARTEKELSDASRGYIDEFTKNADAFLTSFRTEATSLQTTADEAVRDFKTQVSDTRERIEDVQQRLQQKIDEEYRTAALNLEEIDRKQKNFIGQTKIFERADTLRESLERSVASLKTDIARIDEYRSDLRDIEKEFGRIRKLGEDAAEKMTRFVGEKRKIDSMDDEFKRLISISQSIDVKLNQVTSSHDTIQDIQASIRRLEEMEGDVAERYERLESRKKIIDTTTDGVDGNFQKLEDLQGRIRRVEDELSPFSGQIEEIQERIGSLNNGKPDAERVVGMLADLDSTLSDLEERIGKMQQAREWLARTETRLSDVSKQADEQVKLMGSLLKEGAKSDRKEKGAPSLTSRDMVVRLAHQGWKVEQIVQATKLSRGEVELILELNSKK